MTAQITSRNLLAIHVSIILFGLTGPMGKLIDLTPLWIVGGRTVIASSALLLYILYKRYSLSLGSKRDMIAVGLLGFLLALHWISFFQAVQVSTIGVAVLASNTAPLFTSILEPLVARERIRLADVGLASIAVLGVMIVMESFSFASSMLSGLGLGLFTAVSFSVLSIANRSLLTRYVSPVIMFYELTVAAIFVMPFMAVNPSVVEPKSLVYLLILGVILTAFAHTVYTASMRYLKARLANLYSSLVPVYAVIFASYFLHESLTLPVVFGGLIILSSSTYATYLHARSRVAKFDG